MINEQELIDQIKKLGVNSAAVVEVSKILFDPELRKLCNPQACQSYNNNWGCPPAVGNIHSLIQKGKIL